MPNNPSPGKFINSSQLINNSQNTSDFLGVHQGPEKSPLVTHFSDKIDSYLWSLNTPAYKEESYGGVFEKGLHPSGIVGEHCPRRMVYGYHDVKGVHEDDLINPTLRRVFDTGHSIHDRWQKYLSRFRGSINLLGNWKCTFCKSLFSEEVTSYPETAGESTPCPKCKRQASSMWKYSEVRIRDEALKIRGKCDGILEVYGKLAFLEIKSMRWEGFKNLTQPKPEHISQVMLYMKFYPAKVEKALILYESKNDHSLKIYEVPYDEDFIAKELNLIKIASDNIDTETLPPREPYVTKGCAKCKYRKVCK